MTEKITKILGQVLVVAVGALVALKINENLGRTKLKMPTKEQ